MSWWRAHVRIDVGEHHDVEEVQRRVRHRATGYRPPVVVNLEEEDVIVMESANTHRRPWGRLDHLLDGHSDQRGVAVEAPDLLPLSFGVDAG